MSAMNKIAVYAIAKNEEKFVDRFMDSVCEADYVCVLDTGSTDKTVELLKKRGAIVETKVVTPWRFDVARNESLKLIPSDADILVCIDLDEVISKGWADKVRQSWTENTTRARYPYIWNHNEDGSDGIMFASEKIHDRSYRWVNPVHEILKTDKPELYTLMDIRIDHWADNTKPRSSYLPLLELAVAEDPDNDRNVHYLGREYMNYQQFDKAILMLKRHLEMPSATWDAERAASMRFIGKCEFALGNADVAELWFTRAIAEAPQYREGWYEMAWLTYEQKRWTHCIHYGEHLLSIKRRPLSYICEVAPWGAMPYDILSVAHWNAGNKARAIELAEIALKYGENQRITDNIKLMKEAV